MQPVPYAPCVRIAGLLNRSADDRAQLHRDEISNQMKVRRGTVGRSFQYRMSEKSALIIVSSAMIFTTYNDYLWAGYLSRYSN